VPAPASLKELRPPLALPRVSLREIGSVHWFKI
jgi:hypothetical protein